MTRPRQLALFAPPARKPKRGRPKKPGAGLPHVTRPPVLPSRPHHVTIRVRRGTWNLRSQRCFRRIESALVGVRTRGTFRVVHYSVQGNHVHFIVEAQNRRSMSNGLRALLIRMARQLNREMGVQGSRFADRYHETILASPTQVRNALKYVLENHAHHVGGSALDVYSSAPWFADWAPQAPRPRWLPCVSPPTSPPSSWLLRSGWKRAPDVR